MADCPCCSKLEFEDCCAPYLAGDKKAPTAEALMRARYTAFVKGNIKYIVDTIHPRQRQEADEDSARNWSETSEWHGLEIISTEGGQKGDTKGTVEFIASYTQEDEDEEHHELAKFEKLDGTWYFADGNLVGKEPYVRTEPKVGRNDPCPCGSNKKYKKCCGR